MELGGDERGQGETGADGWRRTGGVQVLQDAVVHRVQVLDVEGWERQ